MSRERLLIEEFCDTRDASGLYRKYSAFAIGERIVPRHVFFSRDWLLKAPQLVAQELVAEELAYVRDNPHEAALREIFALARITYGRIDYALKDGRVQVWEINTNPQLLSFDDGGGPSRLPTTVSRGARRGGVSRHRRRRARADRRRDQEPRRPRAARTAVAETYHWTLRSLGLLTRSRRSWRT